MCLHIVFLCLIYLFVQSECAELEQSCPPPKSGAVSHPDPPSLTIQGRLSGHGSFQADPQTFNVECSASYPVQLFFDKTEQNKWNYFWTNTFYTNISNKSTYRFVETGNIIYGAHSQHENIACVAVDSPCLQHRLQITPVSGNSSKLQFTLEKSTNLASSLPDNQPLALIPTGECDAFFYYEAVAGNYQFRCKFSDGTPGLVQRAECGNSMGCDHILRKTGFQTGCWSRFTPKSCDGCTVVEGSKNFVSSVNTCESGDRKSGGTLLLYDLTSDDSSLPNIYFSADVLQEGENKSEPFIKLFELEPRQELNSFLKVECRVSGYPVADNMQFALEYEDTPANQLQYLEAKRTVWVDIGSYRSLTLQPSLQLNDTKLKKIHCFAPIENTYKFLHVSRPIIVEDTNELKEKEMRRSNVILITSTVIPVLLIFGIITVFLLFRINRLKQELRNLTEEEIRDFKYGSPLLDPNDLHAPINAKPFNSELEIARELLELDENSVLGSGQYGIVLKGYILDKSKVTSPTGKELVAVKTVKSSVDVETFKALLSEIKIMGYLEKHENLACLLGACTANIKEREVWAAIEFCANGDLLGYLKKNKPVFKNLFHSSKNGSNTLSSYVNLADCEYANKTFNTLDLLKFAEGVASGMNYLTVKKVIHGDLAARNVLITDTMAVKISDFGLSRQLLEYSNYVKKQQVPLPWKWMSIESLKNMEFSVKSDCWSYGVVLWELFSLGDSPYPGFSWTMEFLADLTAGYRMKKPDYASDEVYNMMLDCWRMVPESRPSFDLIHSQILQISADLASKTKTNC